MTANATHTIVEPPADLADRSVPALFAALYDWLGRTAARVLNAELRALGLDESALVHEAYLRLSGLDRDFSCEAGFRVAARRTLQRAAVDYVRRQRRLKRGGRRSSVSIEIANAIADTRDTLAEVEIGDLLARLHVVNPRLARIARRLQRGASAGSIAREMGLSVSTVRSDCRQIRAWLRRQSVR